MAVGCLRGLHGSFGQGFGGILGFFVTRDGLCVLYRVWVNILSALGEGRFLFIARIGRVKGVGGSPSGTKIDTTDIRKSTNPAIRERNPGGEGDRGGRCGQWRTIWELTTIDLL